MAGVAQPEVFGREGELATVQPFLDSIRAGPAALLFEGEAGIGKTTVWRAGVEAARAGSFRVLACRAAESETKLPFTALADLFAIVPEETLAELPLPQGQALDVALLKAEWKGRPADPRAVSMGVLSVLRSLAETGPVVLAVDDVQWLDPSTAGVLEFVLRRLDTAPVGVLGAVRGSTDHTAPLGLDRAPTRVHRVTVAALSASTLGAIIAARLGFRLQRPTLRELHRISGGNPFYALEIARALHRRGAELAPGEALPIPPSLTELLSERLAGLPAKTMEVLESMSAVANPSATLAGAVVGTAAADKALDRAERAGVVEIDDDRVSFTHPLLGAHVYARIPAGRKRDLHGRLAGLISDPEDRARHLALGGTGPDEAVASALEEAALRAVARGAPETGAELLERAYRLTPTEAGDEARRRALAALAYYEASGLFAPGGRLCEELLASWPPDVPRGRVLYRLANVRAVHAMQDAADLLEQALVESGGDLALETDIHIKLAFASWHLGSWEGSERHDREALRLAEESGGRLVIANALLALASDWVVAGWGIPQHLIDRYAELEDDTPEWRLQVVHLYVPLFLLWTGRLAEAREGLERWLLGAQESGADPIGAVSYLCELEVRSGNFERALLLATGMADLLSGPDNLTNGLVLTRVAWVEAHLGRVEQARAHAEQAMAIAEPIGWQEARMWLLAVLGFIELSLGNAARAAEFIAPAISMARQIGFGEPGLMIGVPDGIEALISAGRLDEAKEALEWWEERSRATDRAIGLATAARCRGFLLASLGDAPGALDALDEALRNHERIPDQPFELGRTLLMMGEVQRRARKRREARASLLRARGIFDRCGAALWVRKADAELGRIGGRPPAPLELTHTEERVAELVAAGRTNKEVAAALFMSRNTVEDNLKRIYRKMNVASRTELAARFASSAPRPDQHGAPAR
jgi:DNA-binding CsgD family transcriptional regulator